MTSSSNEVQFRGSSFADFPFAHAVQFYENEDFLYDLVGTFIADGLMSGDFIVIIATPEHREGFESRVRDRGLKYDQQSLRFIDARAQLESFASESGLDPERFRSEILQLMAADRRPEGQAIRAYGEMVDLLWRDGRGRDAVRLEELWNALAEEVKFSLLCAYPLDNFQEESDGILFAEICHEHDRVMPTESFTAGSLEARQRQVSILQQRAAALQTELDRRQHLERALRQALRAKDEFLATLSHELRTPLTAILGWGRLMEMEALDESSRHLAIHTIVQAAQTQADLIDDIFDMSKAVTGKLHLKKTIVSIPAILDDAIQTLRLAADAKQLRIEVRKPAGDVRTIGDETRLRQILWNLLSNAIKFSRTGGSVDVCTSAATESAEISIRDDGEGIPVDCLSHVFEPFWQANATSTRLHGGLGIGLALVNHLTQLHGGSVSASSDGEGCGATFVVKLPLAP